MIHIIDHHPQAVEQPLLRSMFADRKRLFVDLLGWDVPVADGEFEIDQFDTAGAIYVLAAGANGQHEASMRLLPSTQPHVLGTLFPHLCPIGVPIDETIWESTRLCLPQRHGAARRRELRNKLISALVDVALERGIECYTGVVPEAFRKEVLALGWQAEPLGPAARIAGGPIGAFLVRIGPDTPERLSWTETYVGRIEQVPA